jgi:branched-chain amino acid transport system ATP-binding protein
MIDLKVEQLTVAYGKIEAVHGVSFEVPARSVAAIIGSNGAGKTTILNAISGLRNVTGGTIFCGSEAISGLPPNERVRHGIAQVPEGRRIFGRMSVAENIAIGANWRRDTLAVAQDTERVLVMFPRLRERYRQQAGTLSGGEQQMLAIGRALMSRPRVLLLDEPSMGLAPQIVDLVFEAIQTINTDGVTVLLVEQNAFRALQIAQSAFVIQNGRLIMSGTGAELLSDDRVRGAYLGVGDETIED